MDNETTIANYESQILKGKETERRKDGRREEERKGETGRERERGSQATKAPDTEEKKNTLIWP